ncbi:MAG: hypothetical protein ACPLZD_06100 [Candidatus Saccharicenans sp.]
MKAKWLQPFSKFLLTAVLAIALSWAFPNFLRAAQQDNLTFKKDIIVAQGETQESILSFGSRVVVDGKIKEDVVVFGGEIIINGEVGQSVVGVGSKVKIKSQAVIGEDLVVVGGTLEKEPGSLIKKDTIYFPTSKLLVGEIFKKGIFFPLGTLFLAFKLISLFFGILLTMFVAGIFPRPVNFAALRIREDFWPVIGTGFLALIIYSGLMVISALLILLIIGLPLFFLLLFAGLVIKVFGGTSVSFLVGESFLKAIGIKKMPQVIWTAEIGLLIVFFLNLLPVIGLIISLIISLIGWGVSIRTRFGTLTNWFGSNNL